ncbi:Nn.00g013410.m01.CDS01 [Neocucurbitaria sp. VM-36]
MSEPSDTSGRPLASTTTQPQQPEGNTLRHPTSHRIKHRETSQSSDEQPRGSKTTNTHRRPGTANEASPGPHTGSSRSEQRSTTSPANMMSQLPSVHYTRTGRISKAKKGLKVHNCENCGRSYTRAEHLRRHQKNHAQDDALVCEFPDCGKTFYRLDLLHRHQERHNEPDHKSPQESVFGSREGSPEVAHTSVPGLVPSSIAAITLPPTPYYPPQLASPMHETTALPRYTYNPFRTPQIPRTPQVPSSSFIHVVRSSPSSTSDPNHTKQREYSVRHSVTAPVPIDVMTPSLGWSEPYSQSPGYSSSSGYASPIPGPGDYSNMFANPPYGPGPNRTRTNSNASFIGDWSYPSRSPTSTASTMAFAWSASDKTPTAPNLAYMSTSYPMTSMPISASIDAMSAYGHFGQKTMMQRDEEEGIVLFGEQQYGMGPLTHTHLFEQNLDYYWRLFHPTFPVVHRSTFESMSPSPMLHAAMVAIGGQYSNDTSVKRKSRILHDRCMKLLERRDQEQHLMAETDRLCDYQAMFLIEVHSHYRARRAAKTLSSRFEKVYRKSAEDFRSITSKVADAVYPPENATLDGWIQWIELATWQRLLLSCYILETQQAVLLAREPLPSLIQVTGLDLPVPTHCSIWDATNPTEWAFAAQQFSSSPRYVYEVTADLTVAPFDSFQSSLLLAAHYNRCDSPAPYSSSPTTLDIEHLLDQFPTTTRQLLTAKLVQVTPIRALLAISGESWILSEKIASAQDFTALKTTLRGWLSQLWSTSVTEAQTVAIKEALKLSIEILQNALKDQQNSVVLDLGTDMGIYFAALVLWAITTTANTRVKGPQKMVQQQPLRRQSQSPLPFVTNSSTSVPPLPTQILNHFPRHPPPMTSSPTQSTTVGPTHSRETSPVSPPSIDCNTLLSHAQITINTITFLSTALQDFGSPESISQLPLNLARCEKGCISLLLWVKLRLRGVSLEDQSGMADAWRCRPGEGLGELLDGVTGSLEKILTRGWTGWGI